MGRLRHWRGEKISEAMACRTHLPEVVYGLSAGDWLLQAQRLTVGLNHVLLRSGLLIESRQDSA